MRGPRGLTRDLRDGRRGRAGPAVIGTLIAALGPSPAAAEDPVRILGVDYLGDLPTVVARDRDLFADAGLDAAVTFGQSGRDNLAQLRAGETDFALMALTPLVLDHLRDATPGGPDDPVILASLVHSARLNHVVTLEDSGIRTAADLAGRRVGLVEGTNAAFAWWLFAHYHRQPGDFATIVPREPGQLPGALINGDVDAAVVWEPWITRLEERVGDGLVRLPHGDVYTAKWVLVTRREVTAERPALCRDLLEAYQASMEAIEGAPEATMATYAAHAGLERKAVHERWNAFEYDLNLDWSVIAALQEQVEWARSTGHVDRAVQTDLLSLIADGPLRAVAPGAVGIPRTAARHGGSQ